MTADPDRSGAERPHRRARGWPRLRLGPVEVDALGFEAALEAIAALVDAGEGGYVVTPNVDHVVNAERLPAFRRACARASLSVADGMPLVWSSRLLGTVLPERVAGSDLVVPLCERASRRGWRAYFLGGAPGVAQEAARRLRERTPGLIVAGVDAPVIGGGRDETPAAVERLRRARPDLVFVALGSPKQELWLEAHAAELRPAVAVAVGAALDFAAGRLRRAPRWMARVGLEWAFRLAVEPRRLWRRYLVNDPRFAVILLRELRARRWAPAAR